jgi:hypothetical protein
MLQENAQNVLSGLSLLKINVLLLAINVKSGIKKLVDVPNAMVDTF